MSQLLALLWCKIVLSCIGHVLYEMAEGQCLPVAVPTREQYNIDRDSVPVG